MKVGDQVKIKDGSFMLTVSDGALSGYGKSENTRYIGMCNGLFTVVAVGCQLPIGETLTLGRVNDTIISHNSTGEIWFCNQFVNLKSELAVELTVDEISRRLGYEVKIVK